MASHDSSRRRAQKTSVHLRWTTGPAKSAGAWSLSVPSAERCVMVTSYVEQLDSVGVALQSVSSSSALLVRASIEKQPTDKNSNRVGGLGSDARTDKEQVNSTSGAGPTSPRAGGSEGQDGH
mmetsp:Transcript_908/g.2533  ORF Transcript_908/g.2533 Transcript_908/m.2533 type:complete len:122 (+) Transcript_908:1039-1404(+)